MQSPLQAEPPLSIGDILRTSASVWSGHFLPFTLVTAVAFVPLLLVEQAILGQGADEQTVQQWNLLKVLLNLVLTFVASAPIVFGALRQMHGKPAGIGTCVRVAASRLGSVLGVALALTGLIIGVWLLSMVLSSLHPQVGALAFTVLLLFVVVTLYVAVPVALFERPGALASLRRSYQLTDGCKRYLLGVLLLLTMLTLLTVEVLAQGINAVSPASLPFLEWTVSVIFGGLSAVVTAVVYQRLRAAKERTSVADLLRAFE
ncbi:MAG: hypothetical protein AAGC55_21520 [Myxococcota bacterium]